ncbi:smr domain protein [Lysobacter gummosus]|jgi:DNA-nicking Smr family endonuclease|nr:smr domain protein [Lysobacter gummosus]
MPAAHAPRGDYPVPMTPLPDRPDEDTDGDDDAALFRAAIGEVRRLPDAAPPPAAPKPRPLPRMAERDEALARDEFRHALDQSLLEAGDALSYRRDELPPKVFARLRRGEMSAQEELDLHGSPVREAEALLRAFLNDAREHGLGCVRIIHGKGRNGVNDYLDSRGAPVLKNLVDRMLRQRADILAFHSAPPAQGGTGAVLVLLAKSQRRR